MRDLNERQSQLFFLINSFLQRYEPPELQPLVDDDVVEAARRSPARSKRRRAASSTITGRRRCRPIASRRRSSRSLPKAGKHGGTAFERDAAVVLRRIEEAAREIATADAANRRAYLDLLGRVLQEGQDPRRQAPATPRDAPRLIVPVDRPIYLRFDVCIGSVGNGLRTVPNCRNIMAKKCAICGKTPVVGRQHQPREQRQPAPVRAESSDRPGDDQRRDQAHPRLHALPALEQGRQGRLAALASRRRASAI